MDAAYRNLYPAGICNYEFSGAVPHGTVISRHDGLGGDFTGSVLFYFAGDLEKGGKKLQLGQFLSDFSGQVC